MTFRDQLTLDAATLLDDEEFGDAVIIDGLSGLGSGESVEQEQGQLGGYAANQMRWFVIIPGLVLPVPEQQLTINGELWITDRAFDQGGIMEIIVSRYTA